MTLLAGLIIVVTVPHSTEKRYIVFGMKGVINQIGREEIVTQIYA
jgi:hypothetical protein